jgi:hypothetical protein
MHELPIADGKTGEWQKTHLYDAVLTSRRFVAIVWRLMHVG